jgi:hypothetical protein
MKNKTVCYVEFLNKNKGFAKDTKEFENFESALQWCKDNFEKFNIDMIKYK